jgi:hypothetical protein
MPLIDKTYFVGEINIPDTSNPAVLERLNFFIAKYEEEFLKTVLGYSLWKEYTDGIVVTPTPLAKWTELRDGKEYTIGDKSYKYPGFRDATLKQSPIANYVYYWWRRDDQNAKSDDSEKQVAYYEQRGRAMARAWNEMSRWVTDIIFFLNNNVDTYLSWENVNWITVYWGLNYSLWNLATPINTMNL